MFKPLWSFLKNSLTIDSVSGKSITSSVATTGVKLPDQQVEQVKCDSKAQSMFRTALGKLLWMSQLRDVKYAVKELSRALSKPQASDIVESQFNECCGVTRNQACHLGTQLKVVVSEGQRCRQTDLSARKTMRSK